MAKLVRLYICYELDNNWAWVAPGPERQHVVVAGALEVAEGAPDVDEGAQVIPAPIQAPQPPLAAAPTRTMTQRMTRLEEEVHGVREALGEQREVSPYGVSRTSLERNRQCWWSSDFMGFPSGGVVQAHQARSLSLHSRGAVSTFRGDGCWGILAVGWAG
ncbi:hypothetical protein Tco_0407726 [Tanacetum coccineum]